MLVSVVDRRATRLPGPAVWIGKGAQLLVTYPIPGTERGWLALLDPASGTVTKLIDDIDWSPGPPSPDGRVIPRELGYETDILDLQGTVLLQDLPGFFRGWSFDGKYLTTTTYSTTYPYRCIAVYRASNGARHACIEGQGANDSAFAWSTKSSTLAFLRTASLVSDPRIARPPLTSDLYILDVESGQERLIARDIRGIFDCIRWSPDGRFLVIAVCSSG